VRVLLAMPRYSADMNAEAAQAYFNPCRDGGAVDIAGSQSYAGSLLAAIFNKHWCAALNGFAAGDLHGFAMIHSDVGAEMGWLDLLYEEMEKVQADVISAVIPIKDDRGLTSTAVDDAGDVWRVRRLTTGQVAELPVTFTDKDVGGPLLLNTGLWLCRLGPWAFKTCFTVQDRIAKGPDGKYFHGVIPEDWDFSRQCRRFGLKLAATRRVTVHHWGQTPFSNQAKWGWDHDKTNAPRKEAGDEKGHNDSPDPAVAGPASGGNHPGA
jgi:hypothetical protein